VSYEPSLLAFPALLGVGAIELARQGGLPLVVLLEHFGPADSRPKFRAFVAPQGHLNLRWALTQGF